MSQFSKWKTIGYAAAIFVAGGISGGALGVYETKSTLYAVPRVPEFASRIRMRLQTKLGLTPDQMEKINPIIESAAADLRSIRVDTAQRVDKVFENSYSQVSALLTPDQRAKLDQMQRDRRAWMQQSQLRWQEGHRHHGGDASSPSASP